MFRKLEVIGEFGNMIVIVISDNGMVFFCVKVNFYEFGMYVLLVISWLEVVFGGCMFYDLVFFVDLIVMILDVVNFDIDSEEFYGVSLLSFL